MVDAIDPSLGGGMVEFIFQLALALQQMVNKLTAEYPVKDYV